MKGRKTGTRRTAGKEPAEVLQQFVGVFEGKGWLNQPVRIRHRDRRYRVFCTETEFLVYRINDHCHVPPGFPGWFVCVVTEERVIHDSEMSAFPSTEPSAGDWLRCISDGDFELI